MYCYDKIYKMKYFQTFLIEFAQKKCMMYQNPMLVFWKPDLRKNSLPPTAHICSDRSVVALSNVMSHYVQSSLLMEFLGLENSAIKKVSRDLPSSDGSKKILNISILIALMMRNPNLSSEFL